MTCPAYGCGGCPGVMRAEPGCTMTGRETLEFNIPRIAGDSALRGNAGHSALGNQNSALGNQHSGITTQHLTLSTRESELSTRESALPRTLHLGTAPEWRLISNPGKYAGRGGVDDDDGEAAVEDCEPRTEDDDEE